MLNDTETNSRAFNHLTRMSALAVLLCVLPVAIAFQYFGYPAKERAAFVSGFVIVTVTRLFWHLRSRLWFWITMIVLVAMHAAMVVYVPWTNRNLPGVTLLPIGVLDFFVVYGCVKLVGDAVGEA
jgi:hypothetical protein